MKVHQITTYDFAELNDEAKQAALDHCRSWNTDHDWYVHTIDFFKELYAVTKRYFEIDKCYFSGFWSQGDGAMFEYSDVGHDLIEEFKATLTPRQKLVAGYCSFYGNGHHQGHYHHEKCCSHSIGIHDEMDYSKDRENVISIVDFLEVHFEEFVIEKYEELARELYSMLEKEYEFLTSDEAVQEMIEANEYQFTEDGKFYG